ncbi:MAG: GlxA family transcriptional regulator [Nocardiopsaceae bacterium]|jgi:transcriptional regulator GlxA family with amidase domain|nr:GlxA family transcriptional regulator [Nocardiopsaceae bacterium]
MEDVVVVGYDGAELVDIACVTTAFRMANERGAHPGYQIWLATADGQPITVDGGLTLGAQRALGEIRRAGTLIVSGGNGHEHATRDLELVRQVQRLGSTARRVASVCTGATLLAHTGLLDGRRATTHWFYAATLATRYPAVAVDPDPIFVRDGRYATSGGVTASLDLTLAFIEEDHGPELARWVSMGMVTYLQRPGNQAQMSVFIGSQHADNATVREAINQVIAHPGADQRTEALAARVGVSPRQLSRLFREHLGETPGNVVRRIRLEVAARLSCDTDLPMSGVARRTGFGSAETLRQAFVARYGVSPRDFRNRHARAAADHRTGGLSLDRL